MRRISLLLASALLISGCPWIGPKLEAERLDPDGDGVAWPDDCDDDDKGLSVPLTFFADTDTDGFGDPLVSLKDCFLPDGYVENADDCDDTDATVGMLVWERDADGDTYGVPEDTFDGCAPPDDTWVLAGGDVDCDDGEALVNPGLTETCNDGLDNDCDGTRNDCVFDGLTMMQDGFPQGSRRYNGAAWSGFGAAGAVADLTGDGIPDLLVGAPDARDFPNHGGVAWVIPGPFSPGADLVSADVAVRELSGDQSSYGAGYSVASVGDTNGLGASVVVGAPWGTSTVGYWGGSIAVYADPSSDVPTTTIAGTADYQRVGSELLALGDINADGFDDFAYSVADVPGAGVFVIHGPVQAGWFEHGSYPVALSIVQGEYATRMGNSLALGDTDGDGLPELFIGDQDRGGGRVWRVDAAATGVLFLEEQEGLAYPDWDGAYGYTRFGGDLEVVGDVTGDGIDDLLVGVQGAEDSNQERTGGVMLFAGGVDGALADPSPQTLLGDIVWASFGSSVASAGDADGDGYADVLFTWTGGYYDQTLGAGAVLAYGGPVGTLGDRTAQFAGFDNYNDRTFTMGGVDLNGDGVGDFVVSEAGSEMNGDGSSTVIFGLGL